MRDLRRVHVIPATLALIALLTVSRLPGLCQIPTPLGGSGNNSRHSMDDEMDAHSHLPESYAKMQNIERQRRLVNDTERLLLLTTQLKASIANSNNDSLTPEMLRQMDEIEKLARSVKNKMRN